MFAHVACHIIYDGHVTNIYFLRAGKACVPLPATRSPPKRKQGALSHTPPKTRTKFGRPPKYVGTEEQIANLRASLQHDTTASRAVPPEQRRKWGGTVRSIV